MVEKFKPNQDRIIDKPDKEDVPRDFYTGVGEKEISKGAEKLPALEVKNEVVWINQNVEFPFNIEKGESSRLGMFLTPKSQLDVSGSYQLEIRFHHKRTGILGRVVFKDKEDRLYRDVDLKGIGFTQGISEFSVSEPEISYDPAYPDEKKTLGILDRAYAENDIRMAEKFLKARIRTYRPIALIKIEEIIDKKGEKISLEEAKKRKLVKRDDEPVVEVRAFGTRARIEDLIESDFPEAKMLIKDTIKLVAQERGEDSKNFSKKDYFEWFIENLAISIARMHNKNWIHGYLTPHNITLDARIVDLDSVETVTEINERKNTGEYTSKSFREDIGDSIKTISLLKSGLILSIKMLPYSYIETMFNGFYRKEEKRLKEEKSK